MDQTVALLVAVVALLGIAIGLRFNVYILIPASMVVLVASVMAHLISNKMAGWGIQVAVGLLTLLNAGFALGLLLRAGAAFWSTKRIARLFARSANLDKQVRRPDSAAPEASSEGCAPTKTITPRNLAKESFPR